MSKLYLGRNPTTRNPVNLDSDALLTHAVVIGMTGSGKTGFAVDMIEEAALAGIPVVVIDPKGDLGNLALRWDKPTGYLLEDWVSAQEAQRLDIDTIELAERVAMQTRGARKDWDLDERGKRIAGIPVKIYTPGSTAGRTVNVLSAISNLKADRDTELTREAVSSAVSAILALAGVQADPLRTPEHIFLATLIEQQLDGYRPVTLSGLITLITQPPEGMMVGAFPVDEYLKPRDRQALALALNNLIAAPSFKLWGQGDDLDLDELYGKPGISVFYLAHLDDSSRQFFMTLLLGRIGTWMRQQPGTRDLRGLLFIDEAYGIAPPVANPPTKKPLLTLVKQARAFGIGIVLATQNPSDLDYKALATGLWAVGRLPTEQDRSYVTGALASAYGGDWKQIDQALASLAKRQFLLAQSGQELTTVEARQTLCYLRGPLTRVDLEELRNAGLVEDDRTAEPELLENAVDEDEYEDESENPLGPPLMEKPQNDAGITRALVEQGLPIGLENNWALTAALRKARGMQPIVDKLAQVDGAFYTNYDRYTGAEGAELAMIPMPRLMYLVAAEELYQLYHEADIHRRGIAQEAGVEEIK